MEEDEEAVTTSHSSRQRQRARPTVIVKGAAELVGDVADDFDVDFLIEFESAQNVRKFQRTAHPR